MLCRLTLATLLSVGLGAAFAAPPKLAPVFGDHMVLQTGAPVAIWGTAEAGEKVTVKFRGEEATATAGEDKKWSLKLPALKLDPKNEGAELTVSGKDGATKIVDVLVGEVWLCSGQSNQEWSMNQSDAKEDIEKANFSMIRHQKRGTNKWTVCDPKTAGNFGAVGFYFARKVQSVINRPIGLINDAVGGTRIEPWLVTGSEVALKDKVPNYEALTKQFNSLHNAHTVPFVPYTIAGMLWYQGESNGGEGNEYFEKLKVLIEGRRKLWGYDFPVYVVQLPDFQAATKDPKGGDGWSRIREAEAKVLTIPKTGYVVTIDIGDAKDIHPRNKFDVGERLALWALAKDYSVKGLEYASPMFKSQKIEEGKIRIEFDNVGEGLIVGKKEGKKPVAEVKDGKLARFAIAGEDMKWVWADAVIDGKTVVVSSPDVKKPVAVRYAYSMNPEGANLYSKAGLPAGPFRTDVDPVPAPKK